MKKSIFTQTPMVVKNLAALVVGLTAFLAPSVQAQDKSALPTPPEVWKDYNPDAGDFKEEIISEET